MYKLMMTISIIVRQYCIPNPFEALGEGLIIFVGGSPILLPPVLLNWIAEPIIHLITYKIVGLYYERASCLTLGSFLYLLFYCVHTLIIWLMSLAGFATWAVILIIVAYVGCHFGLAKLRWSV